MLKNIQIQIIFVQTASCQKWGLLYYAFWCGFLLGKHIYMKHFGEKMDFLLIYLQMWWDLTDHCDIQQAFLQY